MKQRSAAFMQKQREAAARYRLTKRLKRPLVECECGKCRSCASRARYRREHAAEWNEKRLEWPAWYFDPEVHQGSSLSNPESPYKIVRGRAGME